MKIVKIERYFIIKVPNTDAQRVEDLFDAVICGAKMSDWHVGYGSNSNNVTSTISMYVEGGKNKRYKLSLYTKYHKIVESEFVDMSFSISYKEIEAAGLIKNLERLLKNVANDGDYLDLSM